MISIYVTISIYQEKCDVMLKISVKIIQCILHTSLFLVYSLLSNKTHMCFIRWISICLLFHSCFFLFDRKFPYMCFIPFMFFLIQWIFHSCVLFHSCLLFNGFSIHVFYYIHVFYSIYGLSNSMDFHSCLLFHTCSFQFKSIF